MCDVRFRTLFFLLVFVAVSPVFAALTRGPYLQVGTPSSVVVCWRTDVATNGVVRFGITAPNLSLAVTNSSVDTNHAVLLEGLAVGSKYYYSIGDTGQTLAGGDTNHCFETAPLPGADKPGRVWVIGDSGMAYWAAQVRDAYLSFTAGRRTDVWLLLGDNAYPNGTDAEYQTSVFGVFPTLLRQTVAWSTRGNHERTDANGSVYYDIFQMPTNGAAGGVASGTEAYYSFDHGMIHFICLDSEGSDTTTNGPMANWLRADLLANTNRWLIAFYHHAPYSKGSHDTDLPAETKMRAMRENFSPILEAGGVDLVLAGHSHSYERSFLLTGHYGDSSSLTANMKVDPGNGRPEGTGAYLKPQGASIPRRGTVYAVVGSSSDALSGTLNHPVMVTGEIGRGSLVLDVTTNRLDAKFIRETGATNDSFTILKVNFLPVATNLNLQIAGNAATYLQLPGVDPSGGALTFELISPPEQGLVSSFSPPTGTLVYTPAHGFAGVDTFSYRVTDGLTNTTTATATLEVIPPADSDNDGLPDYWESGFGISDPNQDSDSDGLNNLGEYVGNTNPTNAVSVLRFTKVQWNESHQPVLTWSAVGGTRYRVLFADSLGGPFTEVVRPVAEELCAGLYGQAASKSFTDDYSLTGGSTAARYYRLRVVNSSSP